MSRHVNLHQLPAPAMSWLSLNKAFAGAVFGAALTASRVYMPSIIVSQMKLQDFHMMATFLAASASSAILIATFDYLSIAKRQPRSNSSINWFSAYDANIIGGALVGVGMAITGACPGTVFVQVASGIKSGYYVALGGLAGGIAYVRLGSLLKVQGGSNTPPVPRQHTIDSKFKIQPERVLLAYELICLIMITGSIAFGGIGARSHNLHPVLGGCLIGLAQAASLSLTGSPIGVSTAYAEVGEYFWQTVSAKSALRRPPTNLAITFAVGILAGSFAMMKLLPIEVSAIDLSPIKAVLGGFTMIVGARLAGGCTSGHGISGTSSFSVSSVITVVAMFAGGIATASVFG